MNKPMGMLDSAGMPYSHTHTGRKQVFKVGRVTRTHKKVWVQNAREVSFNAVCKVIEKGERAEKQRNERRAKR
jgi:hypothetical protein